MILFLLLAYAQMLAPENTKIFGQAIRTETPLALDSSLRDSAQVQDTICVSLNPISAADQALAKSLLSDSNSGKEPRTGQDPAPVGNVAQPEPNPQTAPNPVEPVSQAKDAVSVNVNVSIDNYLSRIPSAEFDSGLSAEAATKLLEYATERRRQVTQDAQTDEKTLASEYNKLASGELGQALVRAKSQISSAVETLTRAINEPNTVKQSGPEALDRSDLVRFQNLFRNAIDKADQGQLALAEALQNKALANVSFFTAVNPGISQPLARTQEMSEIFPPVLSGTVGRGLAGTAPTSPTSPTSNDALTNRIVMLYGLNSARPNLKLLENANFILGDGSSTQVAIPHNGYVFGKTDCSSFVSEVLFAEQRGIRLTTLDMYGIWFMILNGKLPLPPKWQERRAEFVEKLTKSFRAVDIQKGQPLQTGDLLFFRHKDIAWGHAFLVNSYDSKTRTARVLEASQSAGTIRERSFPLIYTVKGKPGAFYVPGLRALRMKTNHKDVCKTPGDST